ncbi:hypothetical protein C2E23DRAFT_183143 [Lenzites betulinus]|nr:hypothetical protein C2E23DRAFT_183143 [Lenzites betulinus]
MAKLSYIGVFWSSALSTELNALINAREYTGNVLPVYSATQDTLIPPTEYEYRLHGALVSLKTAITYQHLGGKLNSDNCYAEIRELKVLSRSPPPPSSPSKKRLREAQEIQNRKRKVTTTEVPPVFPYCCELIYRDAALASPSLV